MRFKDIPQFTRAGAYQINVPIHFLLQQLSEYRQDFNLEMNPDFQRGNVWTRDQQIAFLEFFFKGGNTAKVIYFNHPDFQGFANDDTDVPNMLLVDGLQRLTAMTDFLENRLPIFGNNYYKDFEDTPRAVQYDFIFNVNNLQYRKDVLQWYIDMNSGGTVHSKEEISRVKMLLKNELSNKKESLER